MLSAFYSLSYNYYAQVVGSYRKVKLEKNRSSPMAGFSFVWRPCEPRGKGDKLKVRLVGLLRYKNCGGWTMMHRIKFMYKQFLSEPLWFKILISSTLLIAIIFSSSFFLDNGYYQSAAKLAAAIFFFMYGIKFRMNTRISVMLFVLAIISLYLSWDNFDRAHH